jgi:hypothetical protein
MALQLLGRLIQELAAVGDGEDLAPADYEQQALDDERRDDRLARAGRQVQQHLARAAAVAGEDLPDGLFLIGAGAKRVA